MLNFLSGEIVYSQQKGCRLKPNFLYDNTADDIITKGGKLEAFWNNDLGLWDRDIMNLVHVIDDNLDYIKNAPENKNRISEVLYCRNSSSKSIDELYKFIKNHPDNNVIMDSKITFADDKVKKNDYRSRRLGYNMVEGSHDAFDKIIHTLYDEEESKKIIWLIGCLISGDSTKLQKFFVFYGSQGTGKSTILNIIQSMFDGYWKPFKSKDLTGNSSFPLEAFASNPLLAIEHDGNLSRIEDNSVLNSLVSHETMLINEKFTKQYSIRIQSMLLMGTNKPVQITDSRSGLLRRMIDISPTGNLLEVSEYNRLLSQVNFEFGAIAKYCLSEYKKMGKHYYDAYIPTSMISRTNNLYDFLEDQYFDLIKKEIWTYKELWTRYKQYIEDGNFLYSYNKTTFKEELIPYFKNYKAVAKIDGVTTRDVYNGFKQEKFNSIFSEIEKPIIDDSIPDWLILSENIESKFDDIAKDFKAQLTTKDGYPIYKWDECPTKLKDIPSGQLHYVNIPENVNMVIIDLDKKNNSGNKDFSINVKSASNFPPTYAELSKGGEGIHLHYIYKGDDIDRLSSLYSDDIEIKIFRGNASLRRKLTKCNDLDIAVLEKGSLPYKIERSKDMLDFKGLKNEKALRTLIKRHLNKEIMSATAPSVSMIKHILDEAYSSGLYYDITDMKPAITAFAANSTNQSANCLKMVMNMKFRSDEKDDLKDSIELGPDDGLVFYDVEVFPNLFVVVWKPDGKDCHTMINPSSNEIEELCKHRLVGFNNRKYDNHILYAKMMGYTNEQLYKLSQRIINNSPNSTFLQAYNLSYTDIYDFMSAPHKMSLKKWEIKLGINHHELGLPWDQPVKKEMWDLVADYCKDDVIATETVFHHVKGDWAARKILAQITNSTVNTTTNTLSGKMIFGNNKHPQSEFVYTDLSELFPGYEYKNGKSTYQGEEPGEGGYVYAEPGIYFNVALLDIASMHPSSIEALNLFGDRYTKRFSDLKKARICIKHKDFEPLKDLLDGVLLPYIDDPDIVKELPNALKTVINSVYGLTSARFDNLFKDPRNIDNIVAKRGALFMINLKKEVQKRGYTVAHIKTDSIKIPNADKNIIDFVMKYGKKYGYNFEHEATYERMCLVNNAVYIAKCSPDSNEHPNEWTATGTQFQIPYVFKTLFSKEKITIEDLIEVKSVKDALYLDMNEGYPEDKHNYKFVGKVGAFCPIKQNCGGGLLVVKREHDGVVKYDSATGAKGYRWLEYSDVVSMKKDSDIDYQYYDTLVDKAIKEIDKYGGMNMLLGSPYNIMEPSYFECPYPCKTCDTCDEITKKKCAESIPF